MYCSSVATRGCIICTWGPCENIIAGHVPLTENDRARADDKARAAGWLVIPAKETEHDRNYGYHYCPDCIKHYAKQMLGTH